MWSVAEPPPISRRQPDLTLQTAPPSLYDSGDKRLKFHKNSRSPIDHFPMQDVRASRTVTPHPGTQQSQNKCRSDVRTHDSKSAQSADCASSGRAGAHVGAFTTLHSYFVNALPVDVNLGIVRPGSAVQLRTHQLLFAGFLKHTWKGHGGDNNDLPPSWDVLLHSLPVPDRTLGKSRN